MIRDNFKARPKSIEDIRNLAALLREFLGLGPNDRIDFNVHLDLISILLVKENFAYIVLEDHDLIFDENDEAHTNVKTGAIYIKESVYRNLKDPSSRSHFTIAHEIGHFFLHYINGPLLSRKNKPIKAYESPEWQANQFAAELLMPYDAVKTMSIEEIYSTYKVSYKAAEVRFNKINKKRS